MNGATGLPNTMHGLQHFIKGRRVVAGDVQHIPTTWTLHAQVKSANYTALQQNKDIYLAEVQRDMSKYMYNPLRSPRRPSHAKIVSIDAKPFGSARQNVSRAVQKY